MEAVAASVAPSPKLVREYEQKLLHSDGFQSEAGQTSVAEATAPRARPPLPKAPSEASKQPMVAPVQMQQRQQHYKQARRLQEEENVLRQAAQIQAKRAAATAATPW